MLNNSIINPHTHIAHSIKVAFSFRFASVDNTNTPLLYVGYYNNKHISKHLELSLGFGFVVRREINKQLRENEKLLAR